MTKSNLYTVSQFVEKHRFATHGGLRHLIFNSKTNGFDKVIKRMGRRILIDEDACFEWIDNCSKKEDGVANLVASAKEKAEQAKKEHQAKLSEAKAISAKAISYMLNE